MATTFHFVPKELRGLSDAQDKLFFVLLKDGPQIVMKGRVRTIQVLARKGLLEHVKEPSTSFGVIHPFRPGVVVRASGKAWEIYREYRELQGLGDMFVRAARAQHEHRNAS